MPRSSSAFTSVASVYRAGGLVAWSSATSDVGVTTSPWASRGNRPLSSASEVSSRPSS